MLTEAKRVMVAVQEDEARRALVENLQADGYEPLPALTFAHARSRAADHVDALIVDLGPETTQLIDVIRNAQNASMDAWTPIMAGSASEDMFYAVRLLERGADDVVYEPWLYLEVRARLAALLRRADAARTREVLQAGALRVNVKARRVWIGETEIDLTAREFDLLRVARLRARPRIHPRRTPRDRLGPWRLGADTDA